MSSVGRLLAIGLVALGATPLAAQRYWKDTLYPFVFYTSIDQFWFGGHYGWTSPLSQIERPERWHASVSGDVSFSTTGSYRLVALADFPAWWDGWRASLVVAGLRANRLGYFGLGNDTPFEPDSIRSGAKYFYAVSRSTQQVRATVHRRIVGRLRFTSVAGPPPAAPRIRVPARGRRSPEEKRKIGRGRFGALSAPRAPVHREFGSAATMRDRQED